MKIVRIKSKKEGFRRAGIAHSTKPTDHPFERFCARQLKALADDPMLDVEIIDEPEPVPEPEPEPERKGKRK